MKAGFESKLPGDVLPAACSITPSTIWPEWSTRPAAFPLACVVPHPPSFPPWQPPYSRMMTLARAVHLPTPPAPIPMVPPSTLLLPPPSAATPVLGLWTGCLPRLRTPPRTLPPMSPSLSKRCASESSLCKPTSSSRTPPFRRPSRRSPRGSQPSPCSIQPCTSRRCPRRYSTRYG